MVDEHWLSGFGYAYFVTYTASFYAYWDFGGITGIPLGKTKAKGIFLNLYSSASYILMLTVLICHPEKGVSNSCRHIKLYKVDNKGYFYDSLINF